MQTARWLNTAMRPDLYPLPRSNPRGADVQMKSGPNHAVSDVQQLANEGLSGSSAPLPHLERIQHAFGQQHDIRNVQAHVGGPAAQASRAMGAQAYATGTRVGFQQSPDLHTAAHEAAHVVQQRAGVQLANGVGQAGDVYERHADAVAERVVAGQSAEDLLTNGPASDNARAATATGSTGQVQRKLILTGDEAHINRVLAILNRSLFGYTATVDDAGLVSIARNDIVGPPSEAQQATHEHIARIITDAQVTTVGVESGSPDIIGGSYASESIDIADLEALAGNSGMSDHGALLHELVEQYHKQVHGTAYTTIIEHSGAHGEGIAAEGDLNGMNRGTHTVLSSSVNADGTTDAVLEVPYTRPDGSGVITTLTIEGNNIVSSSEREI